MDSEKNAAGGYKSLFRRHANLTVRYMRMFVLWAAAGLAIGALGGLIGTAFCYAIREATQLRGAYPWLLYFLPAGGLLIVWLYRLRGIHPTDTNGVLLAIHAPTSIPGSTAPLIFIGTTITHLFGGSAGREGAALQLGGVLGYQLGRALRLDEKDTHLIVMCGMSSVFSALFGSPLTAAVCAMEVASVGILHFSAILPCLTASLTAAYLASALGAAAETFPLGAAVPFTWASAGTVAAVAAACAVLSIVYCIALRQGGKASLTVTGGTVCPMAPPFAFLKETLEPHLRALGWPVRFSLVRHGFYQNGGGILRMEAEGPFEPVPLCADTREPVLRAEAEVLNVGLPQQIADREVKVILRELAGRCSPAQGPKVITDAGAPGTANAVLIRIRTKTQTYVFSETGSPTVSAENVAKKAAADALVFLSRSVPVPSRLADQLLVPMALSAGGRFLTTRPSAHTRSCAEVVGRFL